MFLERVEKFLVSDCGLDKSSKYILGVSGGPDSVCLLDILHKLDFSIAIAHFNHQIRDDSDREMNFVKNLSAKYPFEYLTKTEKIPEIAALKRKGIEETARFHRYQFLFLLAEQHHADAVMVAHHANDQVETILMNIIRGSGLDGLTGMKPMSYGQFSKNIPLVRPLLPFFRKEIMAYCEEHGLKYVLDKSNQDVVYIRNRIRHELIPYLSTYNPNISKNLIKMQGLLTDDHDVIALLADDAEKRIGLEIHNHYVRFLLKEYISQSRSMQRILIKRILSEYLSIEDFISMPLIEKIRLFFLGVIKTGMLSLECGLTLLRLEHDGIITKKIEVIDIDWPSTDREVRIDVFPGKHAISPFWFILIDVTKKSSLDCNFEKNDDGFVAYLDAEKLSGLIRVRKWEPGDRYQPMGMHGKSVKLSDFWINHKIPKKIRQSWPILCDGENIIWIPGFQPAHHFCITESTNDVIVVRIVHESSEP